MEKKKVFNEAEEKDGERINRSYEERKPEKKEGSKRERERDDEAEQRWKKS